MLPPLTCSGQQGSLRWWSTTSCRNISCSICRGTHFTDRLWPGAVWTLHPPQPTRLPRAQYVFASGDRCLITAVLLRQGLWVMTELACGCLPGNGKYHLPGCVPADSLGDNRKHMPCKDILQQQLLLRGQPEVGRACVFNHLCFPVRILQRFIRKKKVCIYSDLPKGPTWTFTPESGYLLLTFLYVQWPQECFCS